MNALKFFRQIYFCYFSKPASERALYRLLRKTAVQSIVEVGIGRLDRTRRLIEFALDKTPADRLRYAAIDMFEARPTPAVGMGLKQVHNQLKPLGTKVQLVPGDAFSGLARSANGLAHTDLLIVNSQLAGESLEKAWFYVPRMLHDGSIVLLEEPAEDGGTSFRPLRRLEVEQFASTAARSMRRAA